MAQFPPELSGNCRVASGCRFGCAVVSGILRVLVGDLPCHLALEGGYMMSRPPQYRSPRMTCDRERLIELRKKNALTQEALAGKSKLDV